jgi:hypothetical protein
VLNAARCKCHSKTCGGYITVDVAETEDGRAYVSDGGEIVSLSSSCPASGAPALNLGSGAALVPRRQTSPPTC